MSKYANGNANNIPSILSNMPPCPGIIFPRKLDYVMSASKLNGSYFRSFKYFLNKIINLNKKNIKKS